MYISNTSNLTVINVGCLISVITLLFVILHFLLRSNFPKINEEKLEQRVLVILADYKNRKIDTPKLKEFMFLFSLAIKYAKDYREEVINFNDSFGLKIYLIPLIPVFLACLFMVCYFCFLSSNLLIDLIIYSMLASLILLSIMIIMVTIKIHKIKKQHMEFDRYSKRFDELYEQYTQYLQVDEPWQPREYTI